MDESQLNALKALTLEAKREAREREKVSALAFQLCIHLNVGLPEEDLPFESRVREMIHDLRKKLG